MSTALRVTPSVTRATSNGSGTQNKRKRRRRRKRNRSARIRQRRFALTLNNPTASECVRWNAVILEGNEAPHCLDLTYFVVQTEKGTGVPGDSPLGTVHYQAYCEFRKATAWSSLKKIFGDRIHIEEAEATSAQNIVYCTKNETRFTGGEFCIRGSWGTPKKGGGATEVAIKILNGATVEDIVAQHPGVAMMNLPKIEAFVAHSKGHRSWRPKVTILYGSTGCGKSQYCFETYGTEAYWVSPPDSGRVWFGHYVGQDVCIFDDYNDDWFSLQHMLKIMDSLPLMVAPKGSQVPFTSRHLVFTTNVEPKDWYSAYKGKQEHKDALARRIVDFAEIYDCSVDTGRFGMGEGFFVRHRIRRTEVFSFREHFGMEAIAAGVGDLPSGNGFGFM